MHALLGASYRTLHGLGRHRLLGATLQRWLLFLFLLGALFAWAGWLPARSSPLQRMGLAAVLLAMALFLFASQVWARRRYYVHFAPSRADAPAGAITPMPPNDKAAAFASGLFAVDDRTAAFSGLPAFYRSYPSREHAILARKIPTRFLGLSEADPDFLGMWYIFIAPHALTNVEGGAVYFGAKAQPGLRIEYVRKNKKNQPVAALAFLSFADRAERDRVWADLLLELRFGREAPE